MPRSTLLQLLAGASYPLRALFFLGRHGLWPLALWAVGINVILLGSVVALGVTYVLPAIATLVAGCLAAAPAALGGERLFAGAFAQQLVGWSVWVLCLPLVFLLAAGVVLLLGQVVASPVLDRLSERVEAQVLGTKPAPWRWRQALDAAILAASDATFGLVTSLWSLAPRLVLGLLPGVGALVLWGFAASFLAQEFVGLPLTRHLLPYRARWRAVMAHPGLSLGFGGSTYLLLLLPGVNLLLLPLACVGGTLLYCDMVRHGLLVPTSLAQAPDGA